MAANSIMNSAFQKIGVFGKKQRGIHMLRILLADDDPVFLSKMERLLMQYVAQQQLHVQIGTYTRDDMSCFILQPYDIAFLDIDFGDRRGAGIELARRLRQKRNDAGFTEYCVRTSYIVAFVGKPQSLFFLMKPGCVFYATGFLRLLAKTSERFPITF